MNIKPHAICDSRSRPLILFIASGQVSGYIGTRASSSFLPDVDWLLGDCDHDANRLWETLQEKRDTLLPPMPETEIETGELRQAPLQTP